MWNVLRITPRLALSTLLVALLAVSCTSGTGGTTTPTGTTVTVAVTDSQGLSVNGQAAYQTGDDPWESLVPTATGTYELIVPDGESRYGFAVNCPSGLQASSSKVMAYQATIEETTELVVTCPVSFIGAATTVEGNYDSTALGGDSVEVYTSLESFNGPAATPSGTYGPLAIAAAPGRTMVAVAEDASLNTIGVKVIRNLNLSSAATVDVNFVAGDATGNVVTEDWSGSVPVGYTPSLGLAFTTADSPLVTLGSLSTAGASSLPTVSGTQTGDLYLAVSSVDDGATPSSRFATYQYQASLDGIDLDVTEPWVSPPGVIGGALPTFTNLGELPNRTDFRGHLLLYFWEGIPNVTPAPGLGAVGIIQVFVTTGWRGASTTYQVPDLTGVSGFEGARPLSGDAASWITNAIASNRNVQTLLTGPPPRLEFNTGIFAGLVPPREAGAVNWIGQITDTFTVP